MGRRKTMQALLHFCYWHRMANDVTFWIASFDICQKRKPAQPALKAPMKLNMAGEPNEKVQMDICGPLVETVRGNNYILVITDAFAKKHKSLCDKKLGSRDSSRYTSKQLDMQVWRAKTATHRLG